MKLFRTLAFATLALVLFSLPSFAQSVTFNNHYDAPAFSADFQAGGNVGFHTQTNIPNPTFGDLTANVYEADSTDGTFNVLVAYIDYPASPVLASGVADIDRSLAGSRDKIFANGTATSSLATNSHLGRLFARSQTFVGTTSVGAAPITVYERVAAVGQRIWMAFVISTPSILPVSQQEADTFLDSIVIK